MATWGYSQQVCATCRYWTGQREIDVFANFFTPIDSEGKCACPYSGFRGGTMSSAASCSEWESFKGDQQNISR